MNGLLDDRQDRLDNRRIETLVVAGLIVLLALAAIIVAMTALPIALIAWVMLGDR